MNVVVDTNVLAYYWLPGSYTEIARELRRTTDEWLVPRLWRSEFSNILSGCIRRGELDLIEAKTVMRACEAELAEFEREVDALSVLDLVEQSDCSAYDCEFVSLAMSVGLKLVTEDKKILRGFPQVGLSMSDAVNFSL